MRCLSDLKLKHSGSSGLFLSAYIGIFDFLDENEDNPLILNTPEDPVELFEKIKFFWGWTLSSVKPSWVSK
jgi:hypothetical protein